MCSSDARRNIELFKAKEMTELNEIINDLNITIADCESQQALIKRDLAVQRQPELEKTVHIAGHFTRAIGQLKAARTSLISAAGEMKNGSI